MNIYDYRWSVAILAQACFVARSAAAYVWESGLAMVWLWSLAHGPTSFMLPSPSAVRRARQGLARSTLEAKLNAVKGRVLELEAQLAACIAASGMAPSSEVRELVQRLQLIAPVLAARSAQARGEPEQQPTPLQVARRNTAEHVFDVDAADIATATQRSLNAWQRGGPGDNRRRGKCGLRGPQPRSLPLGGTGPQETGLAKPEEPTLHLDQQASFTPQDDAVAVQTGTGNNDTAARHLDLGESIPDRAALGAKMRLCEDMALEAEEQRISAARALAEAETYVKELCGKLGYLMSLEKEPCFN